MKYSSAITLMFILLLAACGPASTPGQASGATQVALATDTVVVPQTTPTTPPKQADPSAVPATVPPTTTSTAAPRLPNGWQTVAWQGLIIPVPPNSVWETPVLNREQINGVPVVMSGALTYPTSTAPVERPYGPDFTILAFIGSLDDWLDLERRNETSKAGNTIQEQTIREIMIAGRQAKAYQRAVIGTGQIEYYVLKLNNDKLLVITTDDAENGTYRRVIEGLVIREPTAQALPAVTAIAPTTRAQLPPNWQTVEWEGLIIPVPPDFTWKPNPTGVRLFADVPVLASGGLAPNLPADQPVIEYPSGPGFYILQFKGSLEDWLAEEIRAVNALPDVTPITTLWARDTTIAGRPAKAYPPQVGALGPGYETYALRLDSQRLLLITTADATNETYRRVIEGLVITPTVSAQLAPGWQTVEWQGLIIPVPPEGTWGATTDRQQLPPINGIPVLATGGINLPPPPDATLEVLNGPTFSILSFSGSLNEWLALERRNSPPENPIEKDTVRDVVIAGHPAKVYQYTITGTSPEAY